MTGLCHRCGYFHSGKAEPSPPTEEEIANKAFQDNMMETFLKMANHLESDRKSKTRLDKLEAKLDMILDITMSNSEAERLGKISKARSKAKKNPVLASIRKANETQ